MEQFNAHKLKINNLKIFCRRRNSLTVLLYLCYIIYLIKSSFYIYLLQPHIKFLQSMGGAVNPPLFRLQNKLYLPELFFHHNDDQSCSFFLQYTKYIAITTKINNIVQRAVVHTTADISLPAQCCPSSAMAICDTVIVTIKEDNEKCV